MGKDDGKTDIGFGRKAARLCVGNYREVVGLIKVCAASVKTAQRKNNSCGRFGVGCLSFHSTLDVRWWKFMAFSQTATALILARRPLLACVLS